MDACTKHQTPTLGHSKKSVGHIKDAEMRLQEQRCST